MSKLEIIERLEKLEKLIKRLERIQCCQRCVSSVSYTTDQGSQSGTEVLEIYLNGEQVTGGSGTSSFTVNLGDTVGIRIGTEGPFDTWSVTVDDNISRIIDESGFSSIETFEFIVQCNQLYVIDAQVS